MMNRGEFLEKDSNRNHLYNLIKRYREETGKEATSRGEITEEFQIWRIQNEKEN